MITARSSIMAAVCLALGASCAELDSAPGSVASPDGRRFVHEVYPVLLRDCAFSSCHGSPDRFMRVVGPGRQRLQPEQTEVTEPMTYEEVLFSYERVRSMLATGATPAESLLLMKPLEYSAGGQGHRGADDYGRNVYRSREDPALQVIARWASSVGLPPSDDDIAAANERAEAAKVQLSERFDLAQEPE